MESQERGDRNRELALRTLLALTSAVFGVSLYLLANTSREQHEWWVYLFVAACAAIGLVPLLAIPAYSEWHEIDPGERFRRFMSASTGDDFAAFFSASAKASARLLQEVLQENDRRRQLDTAYMVVMGWRPSHKDSPLWLHDSYSEPGKLLRWDAEKNCLWLPDARCVVLPTRRDLNNIQSQL